MINLTYQPLNSFNSPAGTYGLARINGCFHLGGTNYFTYKCLNCGEVQIKKGVKATEWGGIYDL